MSVNSRLKSHLDHRSKESILLAGSSRARKETVGIGILVTSRNSEPVEPVPMNICQSNTYRKDLSWLNFDNEPKVQERQQEKDQQSYIFLLVAYLAIPSSN